MEWFKFLKRTFPTITGYSAGACVGLMLAGGPARADDPKEIQELKARMERLEKQNADLISALQAQHAQQVPTMPVGSSEMMFGTAEYPQTSGNPGSAVSAIIDPVFAKNMKAYEAQKKADADAAAKAAEEKKACEGYVVGSDTKGGLSWENGWLWLRTPNNDFNMHIGAWLQMDSVWFGQTPALRTAQGGRSGPAQGVASGAPQGGIGNLEDGFFFRRIRPFIEGTFYEVGEYRINIALENDQFNSVGLDEVWVGLNKIPVIGSVRVGHFKNAMGLEGDMTSSSRTMTFMERSAYSEAIELNQNFGTGLWFGNSYFDDRITSQSTLVVPDNGQSSGAFFGDGQYGANTRLTALPLYECDGRELLHVGGSIGWRNGASNDATSSDKTITLQARPALRDDDPAGGGPSAIPNANSNRMVSTGPIALKDDYILGTELLYIRGPLSFQGEYGWNFVHDAYGIGPTGLKLNPAINPAQDYTFNGGYMQVCYTLTGENRAYDKKLGCLARDYFKNGPYTNFWLVRDADGRLNPGLGAWELCARYDFIDLNDGSGANRIQGGVMQGLSAGLNWYLNRDLKVQFQYNYSHRYDLPSGVIPGYVSSFGIETQLSF